MNLEKIGFFFIMNTLNQLNGVKFHLLGAVKEVLLAMQTSVGVLHQSPIKSFLGNKAPFMNPLIDQVTQFLDYSIQKVEPTALPGQGEDLQKVKKLKAQVLDSLISAINEEIENTQGTHLEKNKVKIEALITVKNVLMGQREPQVTKGRENTRSAHVA